MNETNNPSTKSHDSNPDPITGEPGAHPIGTGLGATGAGAVGAAIGAVGGPVGVVAGTAIGAVIGGLAGKTVAESIDPTNEDGYWQQHHGHQVYGNHASYDRYKMAYRTGYEGVARHGLEKSYFDVENDLKSAYEKSREQGSVTWEHAQHAARAAFDKARAGVKQG